MLGELTFSVKKSPCGKSFSKQARKSATASLVSTILVRPMFMPRGIFGSPAARAQAIELERNRHRAFIVEAETIDQRQIFGQAVKPRLGIARLRLRRDRADFHETKTEGRDHFRRR